MFATIASDGKLEKMWLDFIAGKVQENGILRPEIYDSWRRCQEWGVHPYQQKIPVALHGPALEQELERKREFMNVACPVIESLYSVVKESGFCVWVSNESGILLKGIADPEVIEICEQYDMMAGSDFCERAIGTNAIGTCLHLKRPLQVTWAEHYCQLCQAAACSAVPILDHGEVVGILSMTGYKEQANLHTLGMVVAGAHAIQRELHLHTMHQKIKLAHHYVLEMMEALPSGIIVVDSQGVINNVNCKACEMLKATAEEMLYQNAFQKFGRLECIRKTLRYGKAQEDEEQYFEHGKQKLHFVMSCRPIMNSKGALDGAVIILREIEAVMRMTSKMAGYSARFTFDNIIGQAPEFTTLISQAKSAASTASNILILGESGTGKEMVAQAIHNSSPRRYGPFVAINCGALPRELIGSELFGYDEGAFTGAKKGGSPGKFELTNNGTLFLDEIGDMPLDLQLVLLRVLQEKIVVRLGGQQQIPVNVRLIAATNKNLQQMVAEGLFRQDLFYRINVITLELPPLRERPGDIALLARHFLRLQSEKMGKEVPQLSSQALSLLENYSWPGNIRELENILERALVFTDEAVLQADVLNVPLAEKSHALSTISHEPVVSLKSGEKALILSTLDKCQWNISKTARGLGITRATLYRKMRHYGLY